jgi:hypothetical protein
VSITDKRRLPSNDDCFLDHSTVTELFLDPLLSSHPDISSLVIESLSLSDIRFHNSMEDRLGSDSSSLSMNARDQRAAYYPLSQHDNTAGNVISVVANSSSSPTSNLLCMLVDGRRVQQRYKLLIDGLVQVCRVPHAKNIIEKIRFSRFLRRWEVHYIQLASNEISSTTVRALRRWRSRRLDVRFRMRVTWIDRYSTHRWKISLSGRKER